MPKLLYSAGKVMTSVFGATNRIIFIIFFAKGQTVTDLLYKSDENTEPKHMIWQKEELFSP